MPRKWQSAIRSPALAQKASEGRSRKVSDLGEHEAQASGSGFVSKVTSSTGSGCKPRARQPGGQLHQRATAGAVLRSSVSVVVLADRNGCRSRQAARGHSRPCAKSAWTTRDGLASGRESAHGVKERRKPARPAAKRRVRWRALHLSEMAGAKALTREHLSMEGVSGRTKSFVLTSGRWKRSWSSS